MQILVMGPHRSGTSAVAGVLEMMGAYFGDEDQRMPARPDNLKGFGERNDVVAINDRILSAAGGTWCRVHSLDFANIPPAEYSEIQEQISRLIEELDSHRPWMIKDPRLCLTFPLWKEHLRNPAVLLVYREPVEIACSLFHRNEIPLHVALALWEVYAKLARKVTAGFPRAQVYYNSLVRDPSAFVNDMREHLRNLGVEGLGVPTVQELARFIDPAMRHNAGSARLQKEYLNARQKRFWNIVNNSNTTTSVEQNSRLEVSPDALRALSDFATVQNRLATIEVLGQRHTQELEAVRQRHTQELEAERQRHTQELEAERQRHTQELEAERQRHIQELEAERQRHIQEIEAEQERFIGTVQSLEHWLQEMFSASNAVFTSLRWRTGTVVMRCIETLLFRRRSPTAREHIDLIASEFEAWRVSNKSRYNLTDESTQTYRAGGHSPTKVSVAALITAMLRQPRRTAQLMSVERVRNFLITCFKQPTHVRIEILRDYLGLYETRKETQRVREKRLGRPQTPLLFPETEDPEISIIIPVFNQFDSTLTCLAALKDNTTGVRYEVILADDGSTDTTREIAEYCQNIQVVRSENNRGFVDNCNAGAAEAAGQWLLFLNNDAWVENDCLLMLLKLAHQDNSVGIVGSKLVYPDGRLQEAGGIVWCDGSAWNYGRGDDASHPEYNYVREVDYVSGAAILVRRSLWQKAGGFDRRFAPAYYEDTDLAFAARNLGYKVLYQPAAVVTHEEGVSHGTDETSNVKKHQAINRQTFLQKWRAELEHSHYRPGECVFLARERRSQRNSILVVDQYVPEFDKDAGSKSTLQYLRLLVEQGSRVTFLPDNFNKREPYTSTLQQMGIEVLYGNWYAGNWARWWRENQKYFGVVYLHRPHISKRYIDELRRARHVKIIYFGHDLHYLRLKRQYQITADASLRQEVEKWRKLEHEIIDKSDVVYYPANYEVNEVCKQFPNKTVRAIPLNIFEPVPETVPGFAERSGLFFIGGFRHPPNLDGVRWLVEKVLPHILKEIPSVRIVVAGSRMPKEVLGLADKNIIVRGSVSEQELEVLYAQTRVAVVPLRFGAGVKGKVLEAMRYRVPVVTTSIGAEGLPEPVNYLEIADDAEGFAQRVIDVYNDASKWKTLSDRGSKAIQQHFSREQALKTVAEDFWSSPSPAGKSNN